MRFTTTVTALAASAALLVGAAAETHTVTFNNQCGHGTVRSTSSDGRSRTLTCPEAAPEGERPDAVYRRRLHDQRAADLCHRVRFPYFSRATAADR